ncbi:MAG: uracil-DNA glycosylase [Acidobacteria bacterium]|nr:MAG: uracil-DNA glycosylase [Acidobacteriota bacterium]REK01134.1 MAG: uracil-DNA glycosylase [Acidobacteriota bacterium]
MPAATPEDAAPAEAGGTTREESDERTRRIAACASLDELGELAAGCVACPLAQTRRSVVFGSGSPTAELMFVGEGPGAQEDLKGLPFVGPAGELLTKIIEAIDLERGQVYIANVVKCRPPNNRDPQPGEVSACIGFLRRQVELVQPKLIVALGRVAAQNLLETDAPVGRMRGRWHSFAGVSLRVTYHPAALLRNQSLKRPTWEDMQEVRDRLQATE